MRVAAYYPWIYLTGGAERVLIEVTGRSRHDWTIFTNHFDREATFPEFRDRKVVTLPSVSVDRKLSSVALAGWKILRQSLPLKEYDAMMVLCEGLGDLAVFRSGPLPKLCYCLTPLRIAYDTHYQQRYLDRMGSMGRWILKSGAGVFRFVDRQAWRRYDRVFFISHESAKRAIAGGLALPSSIEILPACSCLSSAQPSQVWEPYFLLPGRIMWTKNVALGIQAFQRMVRNQPELGGFRLIVAGMVDKKSQQYLSELRQLGQSCPNIEFRIAPSDQELTQLYANCRAVLFTPFNEDFGIIPLEGMSFGKPVVAVNNGGPRETIEDRVDGFLCEPNEQAFAAAMSALANDIQLCEQMGRRGFDKTRRLQWDHVVQRVDDAIDQLATTRQQKEHVVHKLRPHFRFRRQAVLPAPAQQEGR